MTRDRALVATSMITRLGFLVAAIFGITYLFGLATPLWPHVTAGILMLVGVLATTITAMLKGKSVGALWGASLLLMIGAGLGYAVYSGVGETAAVSNALRWIHVAIMVLATGLAEMNVARIHRGR